MNITKTNKPAFMLIFLILFPAFSLSALPDFTLGGGGGIFFGGLFSDYTITADETNSNSEKMWINLTQEMQQFNFGAYLFFDVSYAVFSLDIQQGFDSYTEGGIISQDSIRAEPQPIEGKGKETTIGFSLMGKYPFQIRENLFLYPLAGITFRVALTEKRTPQGGGEHNRTDGITEFNQNGDYTLSMWNAWLINLGAGLDLYLGPSLFLRTELIYSFRLMTKYEKAAVDWLVDTYKISRPKLFHNPGMKGLTHGPALRLAVGYRFK